VKVTGGSICEVSVIHSQHSIVKSASTVPWDPNNYAAFIKLVDELFQSHATNWRCDADRHPSNGTRLKRRKDRFVNSEILDAPFQWIEENYGDEEADPTFENRGAEFYSNDFHAVSFLPCADS